MELGYHINYNVYAFMDFNHVRKIDGLSDWTVDVLVTDNVNS